MTARLIRLALAKAAVVFLIGSAIAGCMHTQAPLGADAQAFNGSPDKAIVFLVRISPDLGELPATLWINDTLLGTTHPGTFYRMELVPGRHTIRGYGVDPGSITLDARPGRVYYVQQKVLGTFRAPSPRSIFEVLSEPQGRAAIARAARAG